MFHPGSLRKGCREDEIQIHERAHDFPSLASKFSNRRMCAGKRGKENGKRGLGKVFRGNEFRYRGNKNHYREMYFHDRRRPRVKRGSQFLYPHK